MIIQTIRFGPDAVQITFVEDAADPSAPAHALNIRRVDREGQIEHIEEAATRLMTGVVGVPPAPPPDAPHLTPREAQILVMLAAGRTIPSIAKELFLSEHTVKSHVAGLHEALNVTNRASLMIAAVGAGLIRLDDKDPT